VTLRVWFEAARFLYSSFADELMGRQALQALNRLQNL